MRRVMGVTLIELVIALAISMLLLALAIPNFSDWIRRERLRNGAESMYDGLQLARVRALQLNQCVQFQLAGAGTSVAWTVGCVNAGTSCPAAIQQFTAGDGASANVLVSLEAGGSNPVIFNNIGQAVTSCTAGAAAVLATNPTIWDVTYSGMTTGTPGTAFKVSVSAGGGIKMCDPAVLQPDSRAC